MNYYEHHLGDYAQATAHLTFLEDAAYLRMIRKYYAEESPLPGDVSAIQRLIGCRTREERKAVDVVLAEFFFLEDGHWHNKRCDQEIARFREKQDKARHSANARWSKMPTQSDGNANAMRTHSEGNAHQSPVTKHQSPVINTPPEGVSESVWKDFLSLRKSKRAAVTKTALQGIEREAQKAGLTLQAALQEMCARGWTGFKAEWLQKKGSYHESLTRTGSSIFGGVRHEREVAGCVDQENIPSHARPLRLKVVTDVDDGPGS